MNTLKQGGIYYDSQLGTKLYSIFRGIYDFDLCSNCCMENDAYRNSGGRAGVTKLI